MIEVSQSQRHLIFTLEWKSCYAHLYFSQIKSILFVQRIEQKSVTKYFTQGHK